jgi:C-terminal processing protease CtpA/Prc
MRIVSIDGKPVPATFDEYLNLVNNSSSITLEVEDSSQVRRRISIMRSFYTPQTVLATNVLTVGGKKVGYMMLNSFLGTVVNDMNTAFSRFTDERAQELVVDLRYNGGGFVNAAGQLCGLIAGQLAGNQYVRYTYNERYQGNNRSANITSYSNSLRLQRVFFLVNGGSASASELTINALRPFIDVVIIGTATAGKAVGSHLMFHEKSGYVLQPISFKYANARGEADFLNGFTPTRTLQDPVDRDFGDVQEAYLRAALQYIQTGSFPAISAKTQAEVQSFSEGTFISEVRNEITPVLAPVTTTLVRRK